MLQVQMRQFSWQKLSITAAVTPLMVGVALVNVCNNPVVAQSSGTIQQNLPRGVRGKASYTPYPGEAIYGNPLAAPTQVDPVTGFSVKTTYDVVPQQVYVPPLSQPYYAYPQRRNTILINPVIINNYGNYRVLQRRHGIYYLP